MFQVRIVVSKLPEINCDWVRRSTLIDPSCPTNLERTVESLVLMIRIVLSLPDTAIKSLSSVNIANSFHADRSNWETTDLDATSN